MKESTKIMLRRESGHWNRRNSNVANSPKNIPLKIATVIANRRFFHGLYQDTRELSHLGTKNMKAPTKTPLINTCIHSSHVPTSFLQESCLVYPSISTTWMVPTLSFTPGNPGQVLGNADLVDMELAQNHLQAEQVASTYPSVINEPWAQTSGSFGLAGLR